METAVSLFKKSQNCLCVEEERYNWASPKSKVNKRLIYLSILFVVTGIMFSVLR